MKQASIDFLREMGLPEDALAILETEAPTTITGDSLASWLRWAYREGRRSVADPYVWHDPFALLEVARRVA